MFAARRAKFAGIMNKELLHRPALDLLLTLATSDVRWRSRSQLAAECGVVPSAFTDALKGRRGLSDDVVERMCAVVPGCTREALLVPVRARSGDIETARMTAEMRRLRDEVNRSLDDIAATLRERDLRRNGD
jgi:hypothetical protein